jgi:diamine N-acetyltransferase
MMLERRDVIRDDVRALIALKVRPDQTDLVAGNAVTLAQAAYETGSYVWGLWDGDTAVGLMAMVHPAEYLWHQDGDDRQGAYLWRLMIGTEFQGKGYGRAAIDFAITQTRNWGCPRLVASVADVPHSNMGFYKKQGFQQTGRMPDDEVEIVLTVGH